MAGTNTSRLSLYKPNAADDINVDTDLNANLDVVDLNMNYRVCTSSTRPSSPYAGQSIYETDTGKIYFRTNSSTWQEIFSDGNQVFISNTNNASLSSTGHGLQIGATSGANLIADNDSILARNNGAASALTLNGTGGNVTIGASGSLVTIPGTLKAGDVYMPFYVVKTNDTARASTTTLADDPDLTVDLEANADYIIEAYLRPAAINAAKFKTAWNTPSGSTGNRTVLGPGSNASESDVDNVYGRFGVHGFATACVFGTRNSGNQFSVIETALIHTTTAGAVTLQWAQGTSSSTATTLYSDSWMRVTRVG